MKILLYAMALSAVAIIVVAVLKRLKGTVKIQTDRETYRYGESISGSVRVLARKPLKSSRVELYLIRRRDERSTDSEDSGPTHAVDYRKVFILTDRPFALHKGKEILFPFQLSIPETVNVQGSIDLDSLVTPETQAKIKAAISKVENIIGQKIGNVEYKWSLHATVYLNGLDLTDSKSLTVLDEGN